MNTTIDILIATAGQGSRLHKVNSQIHKSLLPYQNKPIIHHIIDSIPIAFKIGIILGYKSSQIKDYLSIAFPEREFAFICVDDWASNKSGTKYSLSFARDLVGESFWYFPCDGVFGNTDFLNEEFTENIFLVTKINKEYAHEYLTFDLDERRILRQFFKSTDKTGEYAFTGVMKIIDKVRFFSQLDKSLSNEFISIIANQSLTYFTDNWRDFGNSRAYEEEVKKSIDFDFSKTDEFTYQLNEKIVKWWPDPKIPVLKLDKPRIIPKVFPKNIHVTNQFLSYSKAPGESFYKTVNPENFSCLLNWLDTTVWLSATDNIEVELMSFYKDKTLSRLELLGSKKNQESFNPQIINGVEVKPWQEYLKNIDWNFLVEVNNPAFIHGDLQFDNIIYDLVTNKFTLIDWRYNLPGSKSTGDLYYDLAKMLGGIYVNYYEVKKGKFKFNYRDSTVNFEVPTVNKSETLIKILENFCETIALDINKVRQLIPLIFWNMAPLHKEPFSNLCWALGISHYEALSQ